MNNKIIVPVDFEQQSIIALDYAKYFAEITNAEIILFHVIEENGFLKRLLKDDDDRKNIKKEAYEQLDVLAKDFEANFKISTKVEFGKVYDEIEDFAEDVEPLFILMGKTEKPTLKQRLLGSNSLHTINEADSPVITVRGEKTPSKSKLKKDIILPLDLTKPVAEQVTAAIEFAKILNSEIKVITVDKKNSASFDTVLLTKMNQIKETIEAEGLKATTKIIDDKKTPIAELINQYAVEDNAHLVVIMTRDEDKIAQMFLGTNAREIIQTCEIPVLSVKPWDKGSKKSNFNTFYDPFNVLKK